MSKPWAFFKRFFLVPTLVCGALGYPAIKASGVWQALAVGTLIGIGACAWALSSILAWKMKFDRDELQRESDETVRELHERYEAEDREAVRQEWEL